MTSTALLHSRSVGERPVAMAIRVKNTLAHGPFGIELRRKCRKTECFEGEEAGVLPQSFYCTFTAIRRKCLIMNGAGEGNRTLVSGLGSPHSTIEPHPLPVGIADGPFLSHSRLRFKGGFGVKGGYEFPVPRFQFSVGRRLSRERGAGSEKLGDGGRKPRTTGDGHLPPCPRRWVSWPARGRESTALCPPGGRPCR